MWAAITYSMAQSKVADRETSIHVSGCYGMPT